MSLPIAQDSESSGEVTTQSGAHLRFVGGLVRKAHRPGTDRKVLQRRLDAARSAPFVQPADPQVHLTGDGRCVTCWPRVEVVDPDGPIPWRDAGRLLGRLHQTPVPDGLPASGEPERFARALARVSDPLLAAVGADLATAPTGGSPVFVHGDWHLGQLGITDAGLALLDIDDLGVGSPASDLGRPAGFWAAGLIPDLAWDQFLEGYLEVAGAGVLGTDVGEALDLAARRAVFIATSRAHALGLPNAEVLMSACRRMAH